MKYDSLEVGQKVTYTCSPGFVMEGRNTLTCARSGAWNRGEPKCVCKRTNREHWKFCRRQCNPSTSGSCRNNQECICDGDCGYSCVPKGLKKTCLYILLLAFMKRFMALLQLLWEYKALSCPWIFFSQLKYMILFKISCVRFSPVDISVLDLLASYGTWILCRRLTDLRNKIA